MELEGLRQDSNVDRERVRFAEFWSRAHGNKSFVQNHFGLLKFQQAIRAIGEIGLVATYQIGQ